MNQSRYGAKAIMFGDMAKGGHMQIRAVYDGDVDTGIRIADVKKDRNSPWVRTIALGDTEYPTLKAATNAYETSGEYPPGYSPPAPSHPEPRR